MASPKTYTLKKNGFTLIEILVAMTLLAVLAGFALTVSLDSYREFTFRSQQELLVSLLQRARAQAMGNVNQAPHGLHIDPGAATYTLFQGSDFFHRDQSEDLVFAGNPGQSLTGLSDVVFTQLSGTTSSGSVILKDFTHPQAIISLNNEGQVNLQY
jgi:prepilin-type N-terminal cleavage/methylation domain-containing protein